MCLCVCVCVCAVVGVSSASFNMVFISNEFLIRKMVFDACYNHRPTRWRRPGSDVTHTNEKQNDNWEDRQRGTLRWIGYSRSAAFDVPARGVAANGIDCGFGNRARYRHVDEELRALQQFVHGLLRGKEKEKKCG